MKIGAMNHPARNPVEEIDWFGQNGFDFVDLTLEPPGADPADVDGEGVRQALARQRFSYAEAAEVVRASMEDALLLSPDLAEFETAFGLFGQAFGTIVAQRSTPDEAMIWAQRQSKFK